MQIDQPLLGGLADHITRQLKPVNERFERLLRDASILDEGDHQFSSPQGQLKKLFLEVSEHAICMPIPLKEAHGFYDPKNLETLEEI